MKNAQKIGIRLICIAFVALMAASVVSAQSDAFRAAPDGDPVAQFENERRAPLTRANVDALNIRDALRLPYEQILHERKKFWVIGTATPLGLPTSSTIGVVNLKTGEVTQEELSERRGMFHNGKLRYVPMAPNPSEGEAEESYSVLFPYLFRPNPHVQFSPFVVGGAAVLQINPRLQGTERYAQVYTLPEGWGRYVSGALDFYRREPVLWVAPKRAVAMDAPIAARVVRALDDPNPLIVSLAIHRLAESSLLTEDRAERLFRAKDPLFRALFTEAALEFSRHEDREAISELARRTVRASSDSAELYGSLLGVFAGLSYTGEGRQYMVLGMARREALAENSAPERATTAPTTGVGAVYKERIDALLKSFALTDEEPAHP